MTRTYEYRCTECGYGVETTQFAEARECEECDTGMLVNETIQNA